MGNPTARRSSADKHEERRRAIADSALRTLGEVGYARASLREIANNSDFSHGVVHYYFEDKHDLIIFCVRQQKTDCVRRYDGVIADSATPEAMLVGFADKLVESLVVYAPMHRLWYDVRAQSMFDERLRDVAVEVDGWLEDMVWRIVSRYAELSATVPAMAAPVLYAIFDGLFQQALSDVTRGREGALDDLRDVVRALLPTLIKEPGSA